MKSFSVVPRSRDSPIDTCSESGLGCPGDLVFVSSRIVQRFYLMRPDREMNEAIKYLVAHYAKKYGIQLFAVLAMSTHFHLGLDCPTTPTRTKQQGSLASQIHRGYFLTHLETRAG